MNGGGGSGGDSRKGRKALTEGRLDFLRKFRTHVKIQSELYNNLFRYRRKKFVGIIQKLIYFL